MGNKHSKSRRQSKVTVDNQRQKPQEVPPLAPPDDERQAKQSTNNPVENGGGRHEKQSTKTEAPVGQTRSSEQQPSTEVTVASSISKGPPSTVGRPPPSKEQHEINQGGNEPSVAASSAAVAGVVSGSTRNSSDRNSSSVPLTTSANATDGYISFSESESEISASSPAAATTADTRVQQVSSGGDIPHNDYDKQLAAGGGLEESQQDRPTDNGGAIISDGGSGDDMWDFGDEDSDDEQACGGKVVATVRGGKTENDHTDSSVQQQQRPQLLDSSSNEGVAVAPESPAAGIGGGVGSGGNDGGTANEPQQPRVVVDRLGRRENAPRRASSSSSSDDFDGWGDDDDEDEEEDEGDDTDEEGDGNVYDWTVMDTGEGASDDAFGGAGSTRKPSEGSAGESNRQAASQAKPKAEANPLASKLGLSSSAPRAVMPPAMIAAARPLQRQGRGRGRGRGRGPGGARGGKVVMPGRGGRPRYSPLMQGQPQQFRPQGRPPPAAANGGDGNNTTVGPVAGLSKPPGPAASSMSGMVAANHGSPKGPPAPNSSRGAPGSKQNPNAGAAPASPAAASVPTTTTTTLAQSPIVPRRIVRNNTSGRGSGGGGGGELARSLSGAADGREDFGACSAVTVGGAGARPVTAVGASAASAKVAGGAARPASSIPAAGGARGMVVGGGTVATATAGSTTSEEAVKDTANITRKKAQLPQQEQLEHPTPVGGSWLKNRYIVNNYILLEPLGTGSYAEVRLAKEKTSNKLYAVKIMNKDFLKKRQVGKEETFMDSIKREIAIMKKVHHPNVLRLYEVMDDPKVNKLYLVLEYCKKGDLMNILNGDTRTVTCDPMNDTDVWYIMRQIVQGLSFLHLQNIVHGDIKPQNLLVGSDNVAKIADFGISKFVGGSNQRLKEQAGTPTFMSPELCCGEGYSGQLADVWALGATMYMIRCGKPPFMANQVMVLYEKIQNDPLEFPPEVNMSAGLKRLLRAMMEKGAPQRITLDQVVSDRWLQQGDYSYARTATAGGTPTSARMPAPGTHPTGRKSGVNINTPHGGAGAFAGGGGESGSGSGSGGSAPRGGPAPGSGDGGGLGLRPPPSLSFLPLSQQGYRAIKVSDDEVHKSINQGTTTGGHAGAGSGTGSAAVRGGRGGGSSPAQQRAAGSPTTPPILEEAATATSPGVSNAGTAATTSISSPSIVGVGVGGGGGGRRDSASGRGHLSETEESWKCRSFKKKMEGNGSDPKYRGGTMSGGDVRQPPSTLDDPPAMAVDGRPPHVITDTAYSSPTAPGASVSPAAASSLHQKSPTDHHEQNKQHQQHQARSRGNRDTATPASSDFFGDDDSDDDGFSSEDPDTLYERECSGSTPTATIASSPSASSASPSPSSARAGHAPGGPRRVTGPLPGHQQSGGSGGGVGSERGGGAGFGGGRSGGRGGGAGGDATQRQTRSVTAKRRSSERFDAVMDTLAAQPPLRGGRGNAGGGAGGASRHAGADGRPPANSMCRPLRDLNLRGVKVTSSTTATLPSSVVAGLSEEPTGSNCCNGRLGLVAAASQRQGKRPSQEDRVTVAADLAVALAGKVERAHLYQQYGLFAIFDGHTGQMSADALHAGLHVAVGNQPVFHQAPDKALVQAFNSFDKDLCERQAQEGDTSGSTGLVALFDGRSRSLTVANVGDSRCVASRAGVAVRLSSDHRLSRADERERVAARGGFVANNRINGVLAVSRSFGDVQHKDGCSPALIATPELRSESVACLSSACSPSGLGGGDGGGGSGSGGVLEFIILATDGLWDVVEDQEAVNFVRLRLAGNKGSLSAAASELTKLALDQGSVDNVSVVLVWFEESAPHSAGQPQQQHPQRQQHQQQRAQQQYHQQHYQQQRHSRPPAGADPRPHVAPD